MAPAALAVLSCTVAEEEDAHIVDGLRKEEAVSLGSDLAVHNYLWLWYVNDHICITYLERADPVDRNFPDVWDTFEKYYPAAIPVVSQSTKGGPVRVVRRIGLGWRLKRPAVASELYAETLGKRQIYSFLFTTERPAVEYVREPTNTIPAPNTRE